MKKNYKKYLQPQYKKKFFFGVYSINIPNTQKNNIQNEIEQIGKKINLLQDRLKKNGKSLNQFQNRLMHIKRIRLKKG